MLIEQLKDLRKERTENLKFKTDHQDLVIDGWSATQLVIVYESQLLKKSSNRKSKLVLSMLVTTLVFQFARATNFGRDRIRMEPDIISKLLCATIWSRSAVQFESEQTPFYRTGRRLRSVALHRNRWNMLICSYALLLLRD